MPSEIVQITVVKTGQRRRRSPDEIAEAKRKAEERRGKPLTRDEWAQHNAEQAAEREQEKLELAQKAKRLGMKKRRMRADDGSIREVWSFRTSYHAMGFQDHQITAAERFDRDYQAAYRTLRGQGYEPSVQGGSGPNQMHISQVAAQNSLEACEAFIGTRAFQIVVAVVIHGATSREIHAMGGKEHRTVKSDMDVAFNALDAFYNGFRRKDRTWSAFEQFNSERSAMIEQAERLVG